MILRNYQAAAVDSVFSYFQNGNTGNPIIISPTGTGKALMISGFIRRVLETYPNQKILVLTHVKELVDQNHKTLGRYWPGFEAGINSAGLNKRDFSNQVIFAGIGSVAKHAVSFGHVDLILIDECDLISPKASTQYRSFINQCLQINPNLKAIGLTATPFRIGMGLITDEGGIFTDVAIDLSSIDSFNWFISEGYLCPLVPKRTQTILDTDGVKKRGGEFVEKDLQLAVNQTAITQAALDEVLDVAAGRRCWLVFTAGVEHAESVADTLNAMGISAIAVHGKLTKRERDEAIAGFKDGEYRAIVNNNILTTGFDHPPIDLIIMLRPTESARLWVQMLGRGTRPFYADGHNLETKEGRLLAIENSPKHDCLVLDFGGNSGRLGPINDPVIPKRKGQKGGGEAPVKVCENVLKNGAACDTICHATVRYCPTCGYEFVFKTKLKATASDNKLIADGMPDVRVFAVDHITYAPHTKRGGGTMLKATYYSGLHKFDDYICLEHEINSRAWNRASQWWQARSTAPVPESTHDAIGLSDTLAPTKALRVWVNKKPYKQIMDYCLTGEMLEGAEAPPLTSPPP